MTTKVLRVPSPQHLGRNWREDPRLVAKLLVRLFENSPTFNYSAMYSAISDMLVFGVPYDQIVLGIKRKVNREEIQKNFLEILTLAHAHFEDEHPDFVNTVSARRYPLARSRHGELLSIPFTPPLVYGVGGRLVFPWPIFWRKNPLLGERLQLFTTVVKEILAQDPDLDEAEFQIHDYSAPSANEPRTLKITNASEIATLSPGRRDEMLAQFAEGFFLAQELLTAKAASGKAQEQRTQHPDQFDLFR